MKTRIFLVAAALMLFASLSFGQGFSALFFDDSAPIPATCGGQDFYGDNTVTIKIFWDANWATLPGPDPADVQPTVGAEAGMVNFNEFQFNGVGLGLGAGLFYGENYFSSVGIIPANPHYYLEIQCADGSVHYYTPDVILDSPAPQELSFAVWTCNPCVTPPSCVVDAAVTLTPDAPLPGPQTATVCVHNDGSGTTLVTVPVSNASNTPSVSVTAGGCESDCIPGAAGQFTAWVFVASPPSYTSYYTGAAGAGCCVTLHLDFILAARIESFVGVAGDNEVTLTWTSASEVNVSRYDVVRNGEVVGHVAAQNTNGANYNYVDKTAHNGTTYTYGLRIVNNDNSVNNVDLHVTATPAFNAAVVTEYALLQNYPNPFNPTTEIGFDVLNSNPVTLKVYNSAGQVVATLVNGARYEGGKRYVVSFDATNLPSGLYFYTVKIGNEFSATKKMALVK